MRPAAIIAFLLSISLFAGCGGRAESIKQAGVADSLAGAVSALSVQLKAADTTALAEMIRQHTLCMVFLSEHAHDTIGRAQAEQLQRFSIAGTQLTVFLQNRRLLLGRSGAILLQLRKLSDDATKGVFDTDVLHGYLLTEKKNVAEFTAQAQEELRLYHSAVKQFNLTFPGVSELVKSYNQGQWPSVTADTAAGL